MRWIPILIARGHQNLPRPLDLRVQTKGHVRAVGENNVKKAYRVKLVDIKVSFLGADEEGLYFHTGLVQVLTKKIRQAVSEVLPVRTSSVVCAEVISCLLPGPE